MTQSDDVGQVFQPGYLSHEIEHVKPVDRRWHSIISECTGVFMEFLESDGTWTESELMVSKVIPGDAT